MRVAMRRLAATVVAKGAAFGLERQPARLNVEPEAAHHGVEHVVVLVRKPALAELQRHVSVAQVVGAAQERVRIAGARD
jgi:hypothetical protein